MIDVGDPPMLSTVEVLLRLIAPGPRPQVTAGEIDWPAVDYLARHTHVAAMLWFRLRNDPLLTTAPARLAAGLRHTYVENARRNRLLKGQIVDVARRLNAAGLTPLLLKGGAYIFDPPSGNAALRYLHDLDFLAPDSAACQRCLLANGFRDLGRVSRPRHERTYHHWPALVEPATGLEVEVHKRPFISADEAMTTLFLAEAIPIEHDRVRLMLPSRACRIVTNVIHAQISDRGFGSAWFNPRYLLEFAEYAVAWPSSDWALAEAALAGNRIAFQNFRNLAQIMMGVSPPLSSPMRWVDRLQVARIRWHKRFKPRLDPLGIVMGRIGLTKDRLRRRYGRFIGWQSVPRTRLEAARANS